MNYQSVRVETAGQFKEIDPNIEFIPEEALSRSVFSLLSFVCQCDTPPKCAKKLQGRQSTSEYLRNDTRNCGCVSAAPC